MKTDNYLSACLAEAAKSPLHYRHGAIVVRGGKPLSMHSEMMAIYSALNASSTLSSSTFSREKPCFKLPRSDKRKARLRRDVLLAYVTAVCKALTRKHDETTMNDYDGNDLMTSTTSNDIFSTSSGSASDRSDKRKKDYKRSGKMRTANPTLDHDASPDQPMLLPTGRAGKHEVLQRQQHSRLRGADVYVTRLGWSGKPQYRPAKVKKTVNTGDSQASTSSPSASSTTDTDALADSISSLSNLSVSSSHSGTGSLHDELVNREPSPSPAAVSAAHKDDCFNSSKIAASRPCYRCITFMHQVGIRRVFWTNDAGQWEGGKVAALVAAMDAGMESNATGEGGPIGNGVFVTKHEVLMLRRMMGNNGK
ncbi:hypothetical protein HII31_03251, partial [Pseudocercospora fuligena]